MRVAPFVLGVACGCYRPHVADHVPCDPDTNACPSGQECIEETGGHFCERPGIFDASTVDASSPDARMAFSYRASIAECIDPMTPNPAMCRSVKGADQLVIDAKDATTMHPWNAYVRFDLDNAIAGTTVNAVTLRFVATDDSLAPSGNSGQVWNVQPFTLADLSVAAPATIGSVLATSRGAVAKLQTVDWPLPISLVTPSGSVYLGLDTTATDGVNYWNLDGVTPPRLVIDIN